MNDVVTKAFHSLPYWALGCLVCFTPSLTSSHQGPTLLSWGDSKTSIPEVVQSHCGPLVLCRRALFSSGRELMKVKRALRFLHIGAGFSSASVLRNRVPCLFAWRRKMMWQGRLKYIRMLSEVEYCPNMWVPSWLQAAISHLLLTLVSSWQSFVVAKGEDS